MRCPRINSKAALLPDLLNVILIQDFELQSNSGLKLFFPLKERSRAVDALRSHSVMIQSLVPSLQAIGRAAAGSLTALSFSTRCAGLSGIVGSRAGQLININHILPHRQQIGSATRATLQRLKDRSCLTAFTLTSS
jgi:hypothetical protein